MGTSQTQDESVPQGLDGAGAFVDRSETANQAAAQAENLGSPRFGVRIWWRVAAGIYAAGTAASILGRAPIEGRQTWMQLLLRGSLLVVPPALMGALVSWFLLRRELEKREWRQFRFAEFSTFCGVGWVLVAPAALLLQRDSHWAPMMMMAAAAGTASSLFGLTVDAGAASAGWPVRSGDGVSEVPERQQDDLAGAGISAASFRMLPASDHGIWLALGLAVSFEGAAIPLARGEALIAGSLLGAATFVFVWRRAQGNPRVAIARQNRRAVPRLVGATALAIVVSILAILMQLPEDAFGLRGGGGAKGANEAAAREKDARKDDGAESGYKGIILWTPPKKKDRIVAPPTLTAAQLEAISRKPLVIPFDGPYWYYQEPHDSPGRHPHVDHGDPALVNIRSVNRVPLMMEAHQKLANSVDLGCCRAIEMDFRNRDNEMGAIVLGMVLTDSRLPGKPSVVLSSQAAPTSEPGRFVVKKASVEDSVRFPIPERRGIQKFDEITVVFRPPEDHDNVGTKIGIEQFVLLPR